MMSPRSFLYSKQHPQPLHTPTKRLQHNLPSPPISPSPASSPPATILSHRKPHNSDIFFPSSPAASSSSQQRKYAQDVTVTVEPISATEHSAPHAMSKRKSTHETTRLSPSSPPQTTTSLSTRPTTPTSPVQIPASKTKGLSSRNHRHHGQRKATRPRDVHDPDSIPAAMAALLAVTDIPRPRQRRSRRISKDQSLTLEAIIERQQVSEKELSLTLDRSPMDLLLSPPEDMCDDENMSILSGSGVGSAFSTRTISMDSIPSLGDSFATDGVSSIETPFHSTMRVRRKRSQQPRRSLEPVSSPCGMCEDHPLSMSDEDSSDSLDYDELAEPQDSEDSRSELSFSDFAFPLRPLKSAFKSNLTASLRALKSAARSISALNLPSIPPDDFLTRSILTIDPKVPYTDERRPPVLEEEPSAALRRYLNPTTSARLETHPATLSPTRTYTASIQMQTYKVQRSRSASPSPTRIVYPTTSLSSSQAAPYQPPAQSPQQTAFSYPPGGMRQRETRENSNFIRIAVMEMAMRKAGKLDDQRPGRARWTLPPRKAVARAYVVGADGVPARWVSVSQ
ncbi:hypothetical protein VDGD_10287 [Verticillium dahliae]|nr:hypothetical protein VDGD_10287 [Verticillium dahliae]